MTNIEPQRMRRESGLTAIRTIRRVTAAAEVRIRAILSRLHWPSLGERRRHRASFSLSRVADVFAEL